MKTELLPPHQGSCFPTPHQASSRPQGHMERGLSDSLEGDLSKQRNSKSCFQSIQYVISLGSISSNDKGSIDYQIQSTGSLEEQGEGAHCWSPWAETSLGRGPPLGQGEDNSWLKTQPGPGASPLGASHWLVGKPGGEGDRQRPCTLIKGTCVQISVSAPSQVVH